MTPRQTIYKLCPQAEGKATMWQYNYTETFRGEVFDVYDCVSLLKQCQSNHCLHTSRHFKRETIDEIVK